MSEPSGLAFLILLPVVGAFNGWFTTYLAIRMLFRPRKPVHLFGLGYVAPLPKRQKEIAERVGSIVENELLNFGDIRDQVVTPEFLAHVEQAIEFQVEAMLQERRAQLPSLLKRFVTDDMLRRAREILCRETASALPQLADRMFEVLSENLSIRHLIAEKVAAFELQRLEEVIFSLAARELRLIEWLCAALGFLIGLAQALWALLAR